MVLKVVKKSPEDLTDSFIPLGTIQEIGIKIFNLLSNLLCPSPDSLQERMCQTIASDKSEGGRALKQVLLKLIDDPDSYVPELVEEFILKSFTAILNHFLQ
jgi:hypothetical protein